MATREELRMLTENLKSTDCIKELRTKEGILNPIEFISEGRDKENVEVVLKRIKKLKADITLNRTMTAKLVSLESERERLRNKVSDMPSSAERESKLDDLNTQFRLFEKYMGVRILTLDYGRMKLIFSNIDKIDPERKFIVEMKIEKSNQGKKIWSVLECIPEVSNLNNLVEELNKSDQLSGFCKEIREAFSRIEIK